MTLYERVLNCTVRRTAHSRVHRTRKMKLIVIVTTGASMVILDIRSKCLRRKCTVRQARDQRTVINVKYGFPNSKNAH
jgi:hypothetical protein